MIAEFEQVILTTDLLEFGLKSGDVGTVVHIYQNGKGYEVEFITLDGETIAVATLLASQVRPVGEGEIAHARSLAAA